LRRYRSRRDDTYTKILIDVVTCFTCEEEGSWQIVDIDSDNNNLPDLVFIKIRNIPREKDDVKVAAG